MPEKLKRCPECHTLNHPDATVCKRCGANLMGHSDTNGQVPNLHSEERFTDSANPMASQSGKWELGSVEIKDENFSIGEDAETKEGADKRIDSVWSGIDKKRSTLGVSRDRRDALVDALKTIRGVIKKRRETNPNSETVNVLGEDPQTIQTVDPFSKLALKSTIRKEEASEDINKRTLSPSQREAAALAESVEEPAPAEPSVVEDDFEVERIKPDTVSTEMYLEPEPVHSRNGNDAEDEEFESDTVEMQSPPKVLQQPFDFPRGTNKPIKETIEEPVSQPRYQETHQQSYSGTYTTEEFEVSVAGRGARILAFLIDIVLIVLPVFLIVYVSLLLSGKSEPMLWLFSYSGKGALRASVVLTIIYGLTYFSVFTWLGGATIGKMIAGIKVIDVYGEPPSPLRALLRTLIYIVDLALFGAGFFLVFVAEHDRALHDKIVGTYVIEE